ncbi:MAG: 4-(cytidine 5'-diphospho)-2-C-methyl-D-erythritol kinase [Planctomycetota bacterium]|jgi:4-diphosphocytidyl-2-C-methyl-D-erythritol kinase
MTGIGLQVQSPAKINWNLRVLGKRDDGFHEIESLFSTVTLYDELTFSESPDSTIELHCEHPQVPTEGDNLICKAARLLSEQSGCNLGVICHLTKRIPLGGGLGGGSSNAATTLLALNQLWPLGWPLNDLLGLAARLGSDVPFFLFGKTGIISGRGEKVRPVELGWRGWVVLIMPELSVSTAAVYSQWRPDPQRGSQLKVEPQAAGDARVWMEYTFNMLEKPVMMVCPQLKILAEKSMAIAKRPVRVSGSGSTLFTAFDGEAEAQEYAKVIGEELNVKTCVVQPVEQS